MVPSAWPTVRQDADIEVEELDKVCCCLNPKNRRTMNYVQRTRPVPFPGNQDPLKPPIVTLAPFWSKSLNPSSAWRRAPRLEESFSPRSGIPLVDNGKLFRSFSVRLLGSSGALGGFRDLRRHKQ